MGSSSLNADVNVFHRLHVVHDLNSGRCGVKYVVCTLRARRLGISLKEKVPIRLWMPSSLRQDFNWTWYVTEGEAEEDEFRFFGYVCGLEGELDYFVPSELESVRGQIGACHQTKFTSPLAHSRGSWLTRAANRGG